MNRDHSVVFEIASKYCISDSFVDYQGGTQCFFGNVEIFLVRAVGPLEYEPLMTDCGTIISQGVGYLVGSHPLSLSHFPHRP